MRYHGADNSLTTVGADRLVESDPGHGSVILATKRLHPKIGLQLSNRYGPTFDRKLGHY
jgi:hypothetical protein